MPEARVYNTSQRPRMLIRGLDADGELLERIAALAPTAQRISSLSEVSQDEWDVLVTDSTVDEVTLGPWKTPRVAAAPHLRVVFLAPKTGFDYVERLGPTLGSVEVIGGHVRRELRRTGDVPVSAQPLVEALEPTLRSRSDHHHFRVNRYMPEGPTVLSTAPVVQEATFTPKIVAFAETADGKVLVGRYMRSPQADGWLIPADVEDPVQWVAAALAEWHKADPQRFPGSPDWGRQRAWATAEEAELLDQIEAIRVERERLLADLVSRETTARESLTAARARGDSFERGLLTQQDAELVSSVQRALEELGFTVVDADRDPKVREKLEDLRVGDPEAGDWTALVEVKGYGKGAKTSDLTQIERFARRYLQRTGEDPAALWYVVNQFKDRDPASRQKVLQTNEEDVRVFVQSGGVVIDTIRIFDLLRMVRTGTLQPAEARRLLRTASGRFETPAIAMSPAPSKD